MSNQRVRNLSTEILSKNWYHLKKITYEFLKRNGTWQQQIREAYDRGNGATILLYNTARRSVILTRQFRLPTFLNGNADGMLIEACAGLLDLDSPMECIIRETEEETGFKISQARKVFEMYMSPGSVTEILYFFIAEYDNDMKVHDGGGMPHEQEDIEVLEVFFEEALVMMETGAIRDAKTIILLQYLRLHGLL